MEKEIRICVNGSRDFNNSELMDKHLRSRIPKGSEDLYTLILGGAIGADTLAEQWAYDNKVKYIILVPDWHRFGKAAGPIRNKQMLDISQELISFWDGSSKGTKNAIDTAKTMGIPTTIILYNEQ
jgi:hypothetical protein